MRFRIRVVLLASLVGSLALLGGCSTKKQIKLEMVRETVVTSPEIQSIDVEPTGRLDTRDQAHRVQVTLRGDPGLEGTFDVAGRFTGRPLQETEPGVYRGAFDIAPGDEGPIRISGHLLHPPSGAHQELNAAAALTLFQSPAPPVNVCTEADRDAFDRALGTANLYFEFNKFDLNDESRKTLEGLKALLDEHAPCPIFILGHADEVGSDTYNLRLSTYRAIEVSKALWTMGIDGDRLKKAYFGEAVPLADAAKSRRVELRAHNPYAGTGAARGEGS